MAKIGNVQECVGDVMPSGADWGYWVQERRYLQNG
jgi:hypothetical protein